MKVKITIEKTTFEERIIEMDEKFRLCACPINEIDQVPIELFDEAAKAAAEITGLPLSGDPTDEEEDAKGVIVAGECLDNGELIFEL